VCILIVRCAKKITPPRQTLSLLKSGETTKEEVISGECPELVAVNILELPASIPYIFNRSSFVLGSSEYVSRIRAYLRSGLFESRTLKRIRDCSPSPRIYGISNARNRAGVVMLPNEAARDLC
jgi:hypothetical protein